MFLSTDLGLCAYSRHLDRYSDKMADLVDYGHESARLGYPPQAFTIFVIAYGLKCHRRHAALRRLTLVMFIEN